MKGRDQYNNNIEEKLVFLHGVIKYSKFSPCFLKHLNSDFFSNFDNKNYYEILLIQTHPFKHRQADIQTVILQIFRHVPKVFLVEKIAWSWLIFRKSVYSLRCTNKHWDWAGSLWQEGGHTVLCELTPYCLCFASLTFLANLKAFQRTFVANDCMGSSIGSPWSPCYSDGQMQPLWLLQWAFQ